MSVNCDIAGVCFHPALGLVLLQASGLAQTEEKAEEAGSARRVLVGCLFKTPRWLLINGSGILYPVSRLAK